jgi:hypothetical protein
MDLPGIGWGECGLESFAQDRDQKHDSEHSGFTCRVSALF